MQHLWRLIHIFSVFYKAQALFLVDVSSSTLPGAVEGFLQFLICKCLMSILKTGFFNHKKALLVATYLWRGSSYGGEQVREQPEELGAVVWHALGGRHAAVEQAQHRAVPAGASARSGAAGPPS